jgi:hypothetical protein
MHPLRAEYSSVFKQQLERQIQDVIKDLKANEDLITHWQSEHDQLVLEDVE